MLSRGLIGCAAVALMGAGAQGSVVINLNYEFSGAAAPAGAGPWLKLTFAQNGANNVRLTTGAESTPTIMFNIAETYVPTSVSFALNPGLTTAGLAPSSLSQKAANPLADARFKADGDGYFDFKIEFSSSNTHSFNGGEKLVFDLSATGLLESDFNFLSEPGGGNGSYHAAAHVQRITAAPGSGWIGDGPTTIPLPAAAYSGAASLGLAAWVVARPRRAQ